MRLDILFLVEVLEPLFLEIQFFQRRGAVAPLATKPLEYVTGILRLGSTDLFNMGVQSSQKCTSESFSGFDLVIIFFLNLGAIGEGTSADDPYSDS